MLPGSCTTDSTLQNLTAFVVCTGQMGVSGMSGRTLSCCLAMFLHTIIVKAFHVQPDCSALTFIC